VLFRSPQNPKTPRRCRGNLKLQKIDILKLRKESVL